jgi:hypothetical protein
MRESIDPILKRKPTRTEPAPQAHRLDEFPAGYPLAGCSPAEPASVSPAMFSMLQNRNVGDDSPANGNLSPSRPSQAWGFSPVVCPRAIRMSVTTGPRLSAELLERR